VWGQMRQLRRPPTVSREAALAFLVAQRFDWLRSRRLRSLPAQSFVDWSGLRPWSGRERLRALRAKRRPSWRPSSVFVEGANEPWPGMRYWRRPTPDQGLIHRPTRRRRSLRWSSAVCSASMLRLLGQTGAACRGNQLTFRRRSLNALMTASSASCLWRVSCSPQPAHWSLARPCAQASVLRLL
jgi:hypothetical protein